MSREVPRVTAPSLAEFERDFLEPSRPVILCGALSEWPALSRWTDEYLVSKLGDQPIAARRGVMRPERLPEDWENMEGCEMPFRSYVDQIGKPRPPGQSLYMQMDFALLAALQQDAHTPRYLGTSVPSASMLWFAGGNNVTPLHYDYEENLHAVVAGEKRFLLYSPEYLGELYPGNPLTAPFPHISRVNNIEHPDPLRFPKCARAERLELTLRAGEMLYLPTCWWHQVHSAERSIAINYWWNPTRMKMLRWGVLRLGPSLAFRIVGAWASRFRRPAPAASGA